MLERLLTQFADAGLSSVTVVTGWLGALVERRLDELTDIRSRLDVSVLRESAPRGTMGALSSLATSDRRVLFAFGDLVTDLPFDELLARHDEAGADLTLASHIERQRLQLGEIHVEDGVVVGYEEKPEKSYLICSGIAVLEPHVIEVVPSSGGAFGFPDLVRAVIGRGWPVAHWTHGAFWLDVNSHETLAEAEAHYSTAPLAAV
jgi:NDP-sugar pyrophosphorylase family protein